MRWATPSGLATAASDAARPAPASQACNWYPMPVTVCSTVSCRFAASRFRSRSAASKATAASRCARIVAAKAAACRRTRRPSTAAPASATASAAVAAASEVASRRAFHQGAARINVRSAASRASTVMRWGRGLSSSRPPTRGASRSSCRMPATATSLPTESRAAAAGASGGSKVANQPPPGPARVTVVRPGVVATASIRPVHRTSRPS